jgi:stage IV sporulation protein FB
MIRFSIFGIPVEVQPFFWLVCLFMSGGLYADSTDDFLAASLFIVAAFVSIVIHELGHAVTGRKLGGGHASIVLHAFGGLAYNQGGRFTRPQRFWMIAAGPGAGFAFLALILLGLSLGFGVRDVTAYSAQMLFGIRLPFESADLISFIHEKPFIHLFLRHLLWINFWWGIINLLPVMPLDGGQITDLYVTPQRRVYLIGAVTATAMALFGFFQLGSFYVLVLFGFLAWQNFKGMKEHPWG